MTLPDVAAGATLALLVGQEVYLPSFQKANVVSPRARPASGVVTLANRGNWPDVLSLRATAGTPLFGVTYLAPTGNITAGLVTGSHRSPEIAASDGELSVQVSIKPNTRKLIRTKKGRRAVLRKSLMLTFASESTRDAAAKDAATIHIEVK